MKEDESKFLELISKTPNIAVQGYSKERIVIYWNKASELIYGYSKEEAMGKKLEDLIIPSFMKDDVIKWIKNWYENGIEIPAGKLSLVHKNGKTVYVYSSHVMLKEDTNSPEMFCIDVDLSEQIKKDLELKKKDEILTYKSKMASMGEMLDNIAHQWRQPLSMISCAASGIHLENEFNKLSDEYLNKSINSIIDNTKYLSQTIDDFRDFVKGTHIKVDFNIYDNLKFSLNLLETEIKNNNLHVIFSKPLNKIVLTSYPNELVQVIINIINNAKDIFNERDIQTRFIFIDLKKEDNYVTLVIKDNAQGIPENIIKEIFKQGFSTKDEKGSGVGLYMSKKLICESMNGDIKVTNCDYIYKNKEYKGAKFIISLPLS